MPQELAAREDLDAGDVVLRALVGHGEVGEPVDLVAPEVDADGAVGRAGVDVDDRAPQGDLAPMLHLVLAPVAGGGELADEVGRVEGVAGADGDGLDVLDVRAEALDDRPHRRHQDARHALGVAEAPHHPEPASHRLDARADALERERLPRREHVDLVLAEEGPQVVGEVLGVGAGRHGDDERVALAQARQPRQDVGPRRVRHGDEPAGGAEDARHRGVVPQQRREAGELTHGDPPGY